MQFYKQNPYRSVLLDDSGKEPCVVKRFHHPSGLKALRDKARARGEYRALQLYAQLGLPVPRPLSLTLDGKHPSFSMQAIPGARALESFLLGRKPPIPWTHLMARLGRLLARLQELRMEHPDLHPGNILVDPEGQLFLVDLRGSRIRRRAVSRARLIKALVAAEAEARDYLPLRLRGRFVAAWRRASSTSIQLNLDSIQRRALLLRRAYVEHGAGRWIRRSSRCNEVQGEAGMIYNSKLNPGFAEKSAEQPAQLVVEGAVDSIRRTWLNSARCVEHRLAVVWPQRLELMGSKARATFSVASSPGLALESKTPAALQDLQIRFRARGLKLEMGTGDDLVETPQGGFLLGPVERLINL